MKKIIILLFLILNFFGSENLNSDFIQPTEENIKLFNSYFENPEIIESRNFIKNSFQNWSNSYFKDFDLKKILKYGEENENEDPNLYTKKKALIDLDFIKDTIEENHGARLVLDKWFFDQLDELIEIAKNKILNSKNDDERLHIIDECIEPLEDKVSKSENGHFKIKIYNLQKDEINNLIDYHLNKFEKYHMNPYLKDNNLYIKILKFNSYGYDKEFLKNIKISINKFYSKNFFPIKNIIFDLRYNGGGDIYLINKILNLFFQSNKKYLKTMILPLSDYKFLEKIEDSEDIKIKDLNNNISLSTSEKYIENSKKYLSNNFIVLMNDMTYSASLDFIRSLKDLTKENNNNLFLIGDKTKKIINYAGKLKNFKLPSEIGVITIPLFAKIDNNSMKFYNKELIPDIYRNYNHINNPDDLIDGVVADVEAYKNKFKFSDKNNAHHFKIDNFKQPIDDDKFVIPNKKYYPKLETTEFGYDIYKDTDGNPIYNDYLF